MGKVKEDSTIYLFGRDDTAPQWWITFMDNEGLAKGATISAIQVAMRKYESEFVCRKEFLGGKWTFTNRYLKFKNDGAKTFFAIKFVS